MVLSRFGSTVLVDGIQLTSAVDPDRESDVQASVIPADAEEAVVYGPALGHTVNALLERTAIKTLHVVVLNEALFSALHRSSRWRKDPRVEVHFPREGGEFSTKVRAPFVVSPAELRIADRAALGLRDRILLVINQPYNDFVRDQCAAKWAEQRKQNAPYLATDRDVSALFGTSSKDAIVIAGGPTTSEYYDQIRARQNESTVIVASTAAVPLLRAGIVPDYVVVLDQMPGVLKHFDGDLSGFRGSCLAYIDGVCPEVLRRWPGSRCSMQERTFYPGGSVLHAEVDLAVKLGAKAVHLYGADLCFPGNRSHVDGAAFAESVTNGSQRLKTVNGYGDEAAIDEAFAFYLRSLEDYIAITPGVRFVKWGRSGCPVTGAEWGEDDRRAA